MQYTIMQYTTMKYSNADFLWRSGWVGDELGMGVGSGSVTWGCCSFEFLVLSFELQEPREFRM